MIRYALAVTVAALLVATMHIRSQSAMITSLRNENAALSLALDAAKARNTNIKEDQKSDAEIDQIPDADLRNIPNPDWMLPDPCCGGLY